MNLPTVDDLQTLLGYQGDLCLSLFVPTDVVGPERSATVRIRLKNALDAARHALDPLLAPPAVRDFLAPASALLEQGGQWAQAAPGVALYLTHNFMQLVEIAPPAAVEVVLARSFVLRPLFDQIGRDRRYQVLAVSANGVRLLDCAPGYVANITPADVPQGMEAALRLDEPQPNLQYRTSRPTIGGPGAHAIAIHGHGDQDNAERERRYVQIIMRPLLPPLKQTALPTVAAGVERWLAHVRDVAGDDVRWVGGVEGSPDRLSDGELQAAAWAVVAPHFAAARDAAWRRYQSAVGNAQVGTAQALHDVVRAAWHGHVDTLYLPPANRRWGRYDAGQDRLQEVDDPLQAAVELVDLAAAHTLFNGGQVVVAPDAAELTRPVAILRFPQAVETGFEW